MWEILGIRPTTDIKEIKSAYARLAKQYNPEESPEEFKRIFDAYKAACAYARGRRRIDPTVFTYREKLSDPGFSETIGDHVREDDTHTENNDSGYDFSNADTEKNFYESKDTNAQNHNDGYDFSDVDTEKKFSESKDTDTPNRSDGYDFSDVDTEKKFSESNNIPKKEKFDFSSVNENYTESDEEARINNLRIDLIRRINRIFDEHSEADIEKWNKFFSDTYFDDMVFDRDFRMQARKIFGTHLLTYYIAKLVSGKFGAGTKYFSRGLNRYTVVISIDTDAGNLYTQTVQNSEEKKKIQPKIRFFLITAIVLLYFAAPILTTLIKTDGTSPSYVYTAETTTFPSYITLKPYNGDTNEFLNDAINAIIDEKTFEVETLYERSMGKWLFEFGYAEFGENYESEINFYGEVFKGTVTASAAEKGAVMNMVFNCSDEAADGIEFTAYVISSDGKRVICTDRDGNEYKGIQEEY